MVPRTTFFPEAKDRSSTTMMLPETANLMEPALDCGVILFPPVVKRELFPIPDEECCLLPRAVAPEDGSRPCLSQIPMILVLAPLPFIQPLFPLLTSCTADLSLAVV